MLLIFDFCIKKAAIKYETYYDIANKQKTDLFFIDLHKIASRETIS
jgi:hypothetical protein